MKRFFAILLALMMIMSLATTVFAADGDDTVATGTIVNATDRTYNAYQIFKGTQSENGAALGDIVWGDGILTQTFLQTLKNLKDSNGEQPFASVNTSSTTAAEVAAILSNYSNDSVVAKEFANIASNNKASTTSYTVQAKTGDENATVNLPCGYYLLVDTTRTDDAHPTYNPALLQVTNKSTMNITSKASGVPTPDKTIQGAGEADTVGIGDTVTFVLTATMPDSLEGYDSYTLTFHDTLSKGLTYNNDAVIVIDDGKPINTGINKTSKKNTDESTAITITIWDVLFPGAEEGSVITVTYTATVNSDAVIGSAGNANEVYLEYSNNPNDSSSKNITTKDEVNVFTFQLDMTKVDGQNSTTKLANAKFVLLNSDGTEYATVDSNGKLTGWGKVNELATTNSKTDWPEGSILTSDANGLFTVKGLDEGTYKLKEIEAPAGYNLLTSPVDIVITAQITDDEDAQSLDALTIKIGNGQAANGDITTGIVSGNVENNAGSTLPETGGVGTTLFYIFGGLMMVGAVVLLVTKKRMAN